MLYPAMPKEELLAWAQKNGVQQHLNIPVRMLQSRTDGGHSTWLWVYRQSDISLQELLCRPSATSTQNITATEAPLAYQQAAIELLLEEAEKIILALQEEKHILQQVAPTRPALKALWHRLLQQRAKIRSTVLPRCQADRKSSRFWIEEDPPQLIYKEEIHAWCGDGRWPEIQLDLQKPTDLIQCRCKKGAAGHCPIGISAIDAALEALKDDQRSDKLTSLENLLSSPRWMRTLEQLDSTLDSSLPGKTNEILGWRIKTNPLQPLQLIPIWCRQTKSQTWTHRQADLRTIREHPQVCPLESDKKAISLLLPEPSVDKRENKTSHSAARTHLAIAALINHPRVFVGGHSTQPVVVQKENISLLLETQKGSVYIQPIWNEQRLSFAQLYAQMSHRIAGNLWIWVTEKTCSVINFPVKKQHIFNTFLRRGSQFPMAATDELCSRIPALSPFFTIQLSERLKGTPHAANSTPLFRLYLTDDQYLHISIKVQPKKQLFSPGQGPNIIYSNDGATRFYSTRDFHAEKIQAEAAIKLLNLPLQQYEWTIQDANHIMYILTQLEEHQIQTFWHQNRPIQKAQKEHLKIKINAKNQLFSISGTLHKGATSVPLRDLLIAARENRQFVLVQGKTWLHIQQELRQQLLHLADRITPKHNELQILPQHIPEVSAALPKQTILPKNWKKLFTQAVIASQQEYLPSHLFQGTLRPYQHTGFQWLQRLSQWSTGACLADEMGLGKTIQSLAFIGEQKGPFLIVAPTSLALNWQEESQKFSPHLQPVLYRGTKRRNKLNHLSANSLVITSYTLLSKDITTLSTFKFSVAIFDEAQMLKNQHTARFQAATQILANFKLTLTGTPIENHLGDLWSILHISTPGLLGPWKQFQHRFVQPIESHQESRKKDLIQLISPFFLRRRKVDVAKDLPPKIEVEEYIELSPTERILYDQAKLAALSKINIQNPNARFQILAALTRLRQLSCHPQLVDPQYSSISSKLERCVDILIQFKKSGLKALVFSQFVQFLQRVSKRLQQEQITHGYLDGSTPIEQRNAEVLAFQGGQYDCFLLSLKAGGTGLNLTQATEVLLLDPWWNPAIESQAADRSHRIGQEHAVTIYRLIARDTIESHILQLHHEKKQLAQSMLGSLGSSKVDLHQLFSFIT